MKQFMRIAMARLKKVYTNKQQRLGITPRHLSTIAPTILELCQRDLKDNGIEKDK